MMLYPPVADLVDKIGSRYQLVNVVAQRARHISTEWEASGEPLDDKPVSLALDEVYAGKLTVNSDRSTLLPGSASSGERKGGRTEIVKYIKTAVSDVTFWVDRPYTYSVPPEYADRIQAGMRVSVPFSRGNRKAEGVVLSVSEHCDYDEPKRIFALLDDVPVLTADQIRLALWMRERFFCTVYEAVKAILPAGLWFQSDGRRKATDKQCEFARLLVSGEEALALSQQKASRAKMQSSVLRLLASVGEASVADLRTLTGASRASISALVKDEILAFDYRDVPDADAGAAAGL